MLGGTAEINFIRWLERSGYDVAYTTDIDEHANGNRLLNYRGFLSVGHDEYWSKQMFDAVAAARDAGVNLGILRRQPDLLADTVRVFDRRRVEPRDGLLQRGVPRPDRRFRR